MEIQAKQKDSVQHKVVLLSLALLLVCISNGWVQEASDVETKSYLKDLNDEDALLRQKAAEALGKIGVKAAVPSLNRLVQQDQNVEVRRSAAEALGKIGDKAAVPSLNRLVQQDQDIDVRMRAAGALGMLGDKAAVPVLSRVIRQDQDAGVKWTAAEALGMFGDQAAVPSLKQVLQQDQNVVVRRRIAEALLRISWGLEDKAATLAIPDLQKAIASLDESFQVLEKPEVTFEDKEQTRIALRRSLDALKAQLVVRKRANWAETLTWIRQHPWVWGPAVYVVSLLLIWTVIYWLHPLWLLRINDALQPYTDFELPAWLGKMKVPLRYVLLVGFFHYSRRVLDAWVMAHIDTVRDTFRGLTTAQERAVHIPVPVVLDRDNVANLTAQDIRPTFAEKRGCLLIWGEGGSGKTSLACQIANWAMADTAAERLCAHRMSPVLIEQELDFDVEQGTQLFTEALRGQMQALIGQTEPLPPALFERLLRHRRVLVIMDRFSEMSDTTRRAIRPGRPDFPVYALVVTSRAAETLDNVPKTAIRPLRIEGNRLSSFMEAYLTQRGKRDLFDDPEYFDACRRLSLMVGERNITVLLAKLYAEQMIAMKEQLEESELPDNIPDLMLSYLNELNRGATEAEFDNRTVHHDAKRIAWECLRETYRPARARRDAVLTAIGGEGAEARLAYLETRLRLIQTLPPAQDRIRFALDPLAEYLAGLRIVECYSEKEEAEREVAWRAFLEQSNTMPGAPEAIVGFLLAVRDCCLAKGAEANIPGFVPVELGKRAGLDPEVMLRAQREQRIRRLITLLTVPEPEDRRTAAHALGEIGPEAKIAVPALATALQDPDAEVRRLAVSALGEIGPEAKIAVPALATALQGPDAEVRRLAVSTLRKIGEPAVPVFATALQNPDAEVRRLAVRALGEIWLTLQRKVVVELKAELPAVAVPALATALQDPDVVVRHWAAIILVRTGEPAVPALATALQNPDAEVRRLAARVLKWIGEPAVPALATALQNPDAEVRRLAARVLGEIGPEATTAVPALHEALQDQDEHVPSGHRDPGADG